MSWESLVRRVVNENELSIDQDEAESIIFEANMDMGGDLAEEYLNLLSKYNRSQFKKLVLEVYGDTEKTDNKGEMVDELLVYIIEEDNKYSLRFTLRTDTDGTTRQYTSKNNYENLNSKALKTAMEKEIKYWQKVTQEEGVGGFEKALKKLVTDGIEIFHKGSNKRTRYTLNVE